MTGCSQKNPIPEIEYVDKIIYKEKKLPDELLYCETFVLSDNNITKQSQVARLIIDLNSAYEDCKNKLEAIKNLQPK